ncbi:type II secretion system F family protein [Candidatus Micrarchaeota archaeon]|nr:type II secretion system F family protein [Candidatus Micrarchaeota archaeon]
MKEEKKTIVSPFARTIRKKTVVTSFAEVFLPYFPDLKKKLTLADSKDSAVDFLEKTIGSSIFLSVALLVLTFIFLSSLSLSPLYLIPLVLLYPILLFYYFMIYPDVLVLKRQKTLDLELVFAGRHLVIALRSGMPLFDGLLGVSEGYGDVSKEFNKIVEKVTVGIPLSQAIREVSQNNPSKAFVRILTQIANSLSSGADVADSLEAVLDQISKEQMIELKEYGQKLTPLVMFFMIFGIILPSLGVAFAIILFSLISGGKFGLTSSLLIYVFALIAIVQFLFLAMVESSRPKYIL